jgi:hypothetical protein
VIKIRLTWWSLGWVFFSVFGTTVIPALLVAQTPGWQVFRCRSFSISYPPNLVISNSNSDSVAFQAPGSGFTIDVQYLSPTTPDEQTLLATIESSIRQSAAQEGSSISLESPVPTAYGNWMGKTIRATLRRGNQGREITATVIPNGESAYLMRLMTPPQYLPEAETVRRDMARTLTLTPPSPSNNAYQAQPSAVKQSVGKWIHADSGGTLEYEFSPDGSFRYAGSLHASGYPQFIINSSGRYQISGASIVVMPSSVNSNGSPGSIVRSSGRYDPADDRIILRQEGTQTAVIYTRAR